MAELFGDKYDEKPCNDAQEPCAHCGRPVNIEKEHWRVEFDGQGTYAIGSECRRLFDAERWQPLSP